MITSCSQKPKLGFDLGFLLVLFTTFLVNRANGQQGMLFMSF